MVNMGQRRGKITFALALYDSEISVFPLSSDASSDLFSWSKVSRDLLFLRVVVSCGAAGARRAWACLWALFKEYDAARLTYACRWL